MPNKTYTMGTNSKGQPTYTTYRVWLDGPARSKTFDNEADALKFYRQNLGARLDKIVTTILKEDDD